MEINRTDQQIQDAVAWYAGFLEFIQEKTKEQTKPLTEDGVVLVRTIELLSDLVIVGDTRRKNKNLYGHAAEIKKRLDIKEVYKSKQALVEFIQDNDF